MKKQSLFIAIVFIAFIFSRCTDSGGISNETKQAYPQLYKAVYNRSYKQIIPFTNHSSAKVRQQARRSLAQTPIDSTADFNEKVKVNPAKVSWFALSMHSLSSKQLRKLEQYWAETPEQRKGISLGLGRQGDAKTLPFLLKYLNEAANSNYEKTFALAVSRLMLAFSVEPSKQLKIIKNAFSANKPKTTLSWLYGFYRSDKDTLDQHI